MPDSRSAQFYRVDRRGAATGRLVFRSEAADRTRNFVIAQYQGPQLPELLTDPVIEAQGDADQPPRAWRIRSAEGRFDFRARSIDRLEECPALYEPLHRPFRLRAADRLALRLLMWLLRLPGSARWLRHWLMKRR